MVVWVARLVAWWVTWQLAVRSWRKVFPRPRPRWLDWGVVAWLRPVLWPDSQLVDRLAVQPGMRVVEVSAGVGRLTRPLARVIGADGQLVVVDGRLEVVERLQLSSLDDGQAQVSPQHGAPHALPLDSGSCDWVVMTNAFGGSPDKAHVADEVYRVLKPGGAVAVNEFLVDTDYSLASTVVTNLVLAGFGIEREYGGFAGYTVVGRKGSASHD